MTKHARTAIETLIEIYADGTLGDYARTTIRREVASARLALYEERRTLVTT